MFHSNVLLVIGLLFAISMLVMVGQRLRIPFPIFLVIGGLMISLIPDLPRVHLNSELVFLIFLPPILYEAAWYTSWKDFWKWKRPIGLLGFGLVFFTSTIVALFSAAVIPGFTLALGFLLGGIISPPDAAAATSVLKGMKIPKRIVTILEGESLVNDASSLIVFRFALAAVITGHFTLQEAVTDFFITAGMGIVTGLVVAHVFYLIHRKLPTTPGIDTALTLMAPYIMYITAELFHFSGVLSVVSGGLFLSFRSLEILGYKSRIQATHVWATLIFILNGFIFILIGLELPVIVAGLDDYSLADGIRYGLLISALTIIIRFIWVYPGTFVPRWLSRSIRESERNPGWKGPLVVSWAGMRGVVSLASALSIPLVMTNGEAFPQRNIILFITFVVILVTLVLQGLTLSPLIRWIGLGEIDEVVPEEEQETLIRLQLSRTALEKLNRDHAHEVTRNELVANLKNQLESDVMLSRQFMQSLEHCELERKEVGVYNNVLKSILSEQRKELALLRRREDFSDSVIRKHEHYLDLEEIKVSSAGAIHGD